MEKREIKVSAKILLVATISITILLYSCDFKIDNPGPVEDEQLNNKKTFPTLVNGIKKSFSRAQNWLAFIEEAVAKQITATTLHGQFGISIAQRKGNLLSGETNNLWDYSQQARWLAEHDVQRMKKILGDKFSSNRFVGEALLFNGYANRLLGENMCTTIIDGGSPQENKVYFERAEENYTNAISIFKNIDNHKLLTAAFAGRASVRVFLDKWKEAVKDSKRVPLDFVYASKRSADKRSEYNRIYFANANEPYRSYSAIDTYYEDYFKKYDDPRVSWDTDPDIPYGVGGKVKWLFQTKYTKKSSPINLSSGHEMVLIRAEAKLNDGKWKEALDLINSIRDKEGVKVWKASNEKQTWTRLKRERGIELWLEGRRLGDLRRWTEDGTPGKMEDMSGRDLCFPIGQNEIETNPHLQ